MHPRVARARRAGARGGRGTRAAQAQLPRTAPALPPALQTAESLPTPLPLEIHQNQLKWFVKIVM